LSHLNPPQVLTLEIIVIAQHVKVNPNHKLEGRRAPPYLTLAGICDKTYAKVSYGGVAMGETKYGKYFLKEPWGIPWMPDPNAPVYIGIGQQAPVKDWDEPLTQVLRPIYKPFRMIPKPHTHNTAEILYFIGGNPMNFKEFGAEVELVMGEGKDEETYIITSTTWVYVPKNLPHCPLDFKRVDKLIMFGHIMFAPSYGSTMADGKPMPPV
jgi:hypothetical protein